MQELSIKEIKTVSEEGRGAIDEKISRQTKAYIYNALTDDERRIYKNLSDEPIHVDEILEKTGMEHAKASKVLLDLELKRLIKILPGKNYIRAGAGS